MVMSAAVEKIVVCFQEKVKVCGIGGPTSTLRSSGTEPMETLPLLPTTITVRTFRCSRLWESTSTASQYPGRASCPQDSPTTSTRMALLTTTTSSTNSSNTTSHQWPRFTTGTYRRGFKTWAAGPIPISLNISPIMPGLSTNSLAIECLFGPHSMSPCRPVWKDMDFLTGLPPSTIMEWESTCARITYWSLTQGLIIFTTRSSDQNTKVSTIYNS